MLVEVRNWARNPRSRSVVIPVNSMEQEIPFAAYDGSFLAQGMGRSMGDSCLNDGNVLLAAVGLDRIVSWCPDTGLVVAEAGVTIDALLQLFVPQGWFVPVTPGTRFVTLGGAVANDVHGKNHHVAGTFGRHVSRLQLRRSDGSRIVCSPTENAAWFRATCGGLGLTGLIEWVELRMKPIVNSWIDSESIRYGDLSEFFALTAESEATHEYVVAWVDTHSSRLAGRGLFIRGNHNRDSQREEREAPRPAWFTVPFTPPFSLLNKATIKAFNMAYYLTRPTRRVSVTPLAPFFYPLDGLGEWHRAYGPAGIIQWQGLIPDRAAVREILSLAARMGGSFLTVMKMMGDLPSPGLLSFSGAGSTIALDFPNTREVREKLPLLDAVVVEAKGRIYPAKDARMSGRSFRRFYPQWEELLPFIDPRFSSSFWRRVMGD